VRAVSRKWAAALQQLDLLNVYISFNNAECINFILYPMFENIVSLANFPMQLDKVVDHCTHAVRVTSDASPVGPNTVQLAKQKDGLRNFVYENCKLYYKTNPTRWQYESYWFAPTYSYAKSDTANSDIDDDDDPDFEEDDGFRYNNYYGDDDEPGMNRFNDKGAEEDMGDVGYYSNYPDESARDIASTRDELGYLNLLSDRYY